MFQADGDNADSCESVKSDSSSGSSVIVPKGQGNRKANLEVLRGLQSSSEESQAATVGSAALQSSTPTVQSSTPTPDPMKTVERVLDWPAEVSPVSSNTAQSPKASAKSAKETPQSPGASANSTISMDIQSSPKSSGAGLSESDSKMDETSALPIRYSKSQSEQSEEEREDRGKRRKKSKKHKNKHKKSKKSKRNRSPSSSSSSRSSSTSSSSSSSSSSSDKRPKRVVVKRNVNVYDGVNYLHKEGDIGVVALHPNYKVYVKKDELDGIWNSAKSVTQFIRNMVDKIYTPAALKNCTPQGYPARGRGQKKLKEEEVKCRLHPDGRTALLAKALELEHERKSWRPRVGDQAMRQAFSGRCTQLRD